MKDPYVNENTGVLKNKLGIEEYEKLNDVEKDIAFVKLINIDDVMKNQVDSNLIKGIHKHIFSDIFEWAGEYRTVPVYKTEVVIPGLSLEYDAPQDIEKNLNIILEEMSKEKWENYDLDTLSKIYTSYLARIWRVHPFRDGNTRTTLSFAKLYAKEYGFEIDSSIFLEGLSRKTDENGKILNYCIRDFFVLASLDKKDYPEPEHLEKIMKKAISSGTEKKIEKLSKLKDTER